MTQPDLFAQPPPAPPEPPPPPAFTVLDGQAGTLTKFEADIESTPAPDLSIAPPGNARKLVAQVIQAEQDFEFYPTTNEIIRALCRDLGFHKNLNQHGNYFPTRNGPTSILDIGAGNGKVLLALRDATLDKLSLHAIEKSTILCQQLHEDILIVGTEFEEQSLLSKQVDIIFSNPPYSQFEAWAEKIIREGASEKAYLVIPERWEKSVRIADAIRFRNAKVKTIGSFDFENAEDRTARAKVQLIRITFEKDKDDAFERFFEEQFGHLRKRFAADAPEGESEADVTERTKGGRHRPFKQLIVGPNYPEALVSLYRAEMANVEKNYKLVSELDVDLLREFEISPPRIMSCLKTRLAGLRNDYWHELFSHLGSITERLTSGSRKSLLDVLHRHVHVDFTVSNICAVLIWVIKNANRYIDSQLLDVYELMVDKCNVHLYKSNQRTWRDEKWRYCSRDDDDRPSHYVLDYRIVTHRVGGCNSGGYSWNTGLEERGRIFLGDLLTIANNLGFTCSATQNCLGRNASETWKPGEMREFYYQDENNRRQLLYDVRAFKNGNIHLRLNQQFILALNVEHGRLRGWLNSPEEAAKELQEPKAAAYFRSNMQLAAGDGLLLLK